MKKTLILVVCGAFALTGLSAGAIGLWFHRLTLPVFFAGDAVRVLSFEAGKMFSDNPDTTPADLERMIRFHHEASILNLEIDSGGRVVDPFGTAFRVENEKRAGKGITTVTSAGPDREFGTRDDIISTDERDSGSERTNGN